MTAPLNGKVALVTGAARGIGRACALKLARAGCDIIANYYNSHEEAEALCQEVRSMGRRAITVQGSVGVPDSVAEMFEAIRNDFDRIDIVVSNAASGVLKPAMDMTLKHFRWCMETNAFAVNLLAQHAVVAPLGLFQPFQIGVEVLPAEPGGALREGLCGLEPVPDQPGVHAAA